MLRTDLHLRLYVIKFENIVSNIANDIFSYGFFLTIDTSNVPPNHSSSYALRNRYPRSARPTQPMNLPGSDHEERFFEEAGLDGESLSDI